MWGEPASEAWPEQSRGVQPNETRRVHKAYEIRADEASTPTWFGMA
jgi:hypothetical protein